MRRRLALIAFVAIALLAVRPEVFRRIGRPHGNTPYDAFLNGVRERTPADSSIALVVPARGAAYGAHFVRASYLLAGRSVLPTISRSDSFVPENYERAEYVAIWNARSAPEGRTVVWHAAGGQLLGPQ